MTTDYLPFQNLPDLFPLPTTPAPLVTPPQTLFPSPSASSPPFQPSSSSAIQLDFGEHLDSPSNRILGAIPIRATPQPDLRTFWNRMHAIKVYPPSIRRARIRAYLKKRERAQRNSKRRRVVYKCRQVFAQSRMRIGGRFATRQEIDAVNRTPALAAKAERGESITAKEVKLALEAVKE